MKLKTLKDLTQAGRTYSFEDCKFTGRHYVATVGDLKQEAIKWIEELRNYDYPTKISNMSAKHTIDWIKHFFNLTDYITY